MKKKKYKAYVAPAADSIVGDLPVCEKCGNYKKVRYEAYCDCSDKEQTVKMEGETNDTD